MLHEPSHALRSLSRTPGFALTAILTLALGIGLSTAVFTVADALLLRRLPVRDQDRIVTLWGTDGSFDNYPVGLDDAREIARRSRSLEHVASFGYERSWPIAIRDGLHPRGDRSHRATRARRDSGGRARRAHRVPQTSRSFAMVAHPARRRQYTPATHRRRHPTGVVRLRRRGCPPAAHHVHQRR